MAYVHELSVGVVLMVAQWSQTQDSTQLDAV